MKTALLCALMFAPPAFAADLKVEIVDKGVYQADTVRTQDAAGSPSGQHGVASNVKLVKAGTRVLAKTATTFGLRFKVVGVPEGQLVEIKDVIRFPKAGVRDPERKQTFYQEADVSKVPAGVVQLDGYTLEKPWELVPGEWVFELWHGEKLLAREKFTLTRAK